MPYTIDGTAAMPFGQALLINTLLLGLFALTGSLFLLLQINLMAVTIALVLLHFYLDGIFWAFRRPERSTRDVIERFWAGRPATLPA